MEVENVHHRVVVCVGRLLLSKVGPNDYKLNTLDAYRNIINRWNKLYNKEQSKGSINEGVPCCGTCSYKVQGDEPNNAHAKMGKTLKISTWSILRTNNLSISRMNMPAIFELVKGIPHSSLFQNKEESMLLLECDKASINLHLEVKAIAMVLEKIHYYRLFSHRLEDTILPTIIRHTKVLTWNVRGLNSPRY